MTCEKKIKAPSGYPLFGWSREATKVHLIQNPPNVGDEMIIYSSHAGFHHYLLATISNASSGPQKRVILSKAGFSGGTSFYRSGINTFMPKGQTIMLPPVPSLMEHLAIDCDVVLDVALYARGD